MGAVSDPIASAVVDPAGFWQATGTLAAMRAQIPEERRAGSAVRAMVHDELYHSEEDHTLGCTERCSPPADEIARLRAALEAIARPSLAVSTRYGNPHAMVARCQRIAREALAGATPEED